MVWLGLPTAGPTTFYTHSGSPPSNQHTYHPLQGPARLPVNGIVSNMPGGHSGRSPGPVAEWVTLSGYLNMHTIVFMHVHDAPTAVDHSKKGMNLT